MDMKRVFLKLSGEALAGPEKTGFDEDTVKEVARQVKISVDGRTGRHRHRRSFWRGRTSDAGLSAPKADQIGMLATIMNCIYCFGDFPQRRHEDRGSDSVCMRRGNRTVFPRIRQTVILRKARLSSFAGGTGHPHFYRYRHHTARGRDGRRLHSCLEIHRRCLRQRPGQEPGTQALRHHQHPQEVIDKKLAVVDLTASIMCMEGVRCQWQYPI